MDISYHEYFKRQTTLSEIGKEGQELLQKAKVLVVGCGGLGSPIAIYLATSGIGELHLVDFDAVSVSNLHRQVFYKVEVVGEENVPKKAITMGVSTIMKAKKVYMMAWGEKKAQIVITKMTV